jgi:hypothetical protein
MLRAKEIERAMAMGRREAEEVLAFRDTELRRRAAAIAAAPEEPQVFMAPQFAEAALDTLGPQARGVIIAEGDSWFDYPLHDVLRLLEDHHGYDVESVAHKGDRVEDMAFDGGQLEEFTRRLEKLLRRGTVPRAILLSGGGNDIAGREFGMLINHAASPIAGLNRKVAEGVIAERTKVAYVYIVSKVTSVCEQRIGRAIPIVLHGYDYPIPDGRGFLGGWWLFPGPWLDPGFREKGFGDLDEKRRIAKTLIDAFNTMLSEVQALPGFDHVHYLDLRGTLASPDYHDDWANELHPTESGFERVTAKFADLLATI